MTSRPSDKILRTLPEVVYAYLKIARHAGESEFRYNRICVHIAYPLTNPQPGVEAMVCARDTTDN